MAVKRHLITVLLLLGAGGALILFLLSPGSERPEFSGDDLKFIDVYVKLSVAGQMPIEQPDSRALARERILAESGVDSLWLALYTESLSGKTERQLLIWEEISTRLDSLQRAGSQKRKSDISPPPP